MHHRLMIVLASLTESWSLPLQKRQDACDSDDHFERERQLLLIAIVKEMELRSSQLPVHPHCAAHLDVAGGG